MGIGNMLVTKTFFILQFVFVNRRNCWVWIFLTIAQKNIIHWSVIYIVERGFSYFGSLVYFGENIHEQVWNNNLLGITSFGCFELFQIFYYFTFVRQ